MNITAISKYIRVTPRKLKLLANSMRTLSPQEAVTQLKFLPHSGAKPLRKVIESALANARAKNMNIKDVKIKQLTVTPGPAMKRFRAVSRGMAHSYKKRMSHVRVVLTNKKSD